MTNIKLTRKELADIALAICKTFKPEGWQQASRTLSYRFPPDGGLELERRVETTPPTQDPDGSLEESEGLGHA
jgi:hypothetical protein